MVNLVYHGPEEEARLNFKSLLDIGAHPCVPSTNVIFIIYEHRSHSR